MSSDTVRRFDTKDERQEPWACGKLLSGSNVELAISDIATVNDLIAKAQSDYQNIPLQLITADNLVFNPRGKPITKAYVWIDDRDSTQTGKVPKYPQILHFWDAKDIKNLERCDSVFGDISYLSNGQAGRVEITSWKGKRGCTAVWTMNDNAPELSSLRLHDNAKTIKVFPTKSKKNVAGGSIMKCPKCKSENVVIQAVTEVKETRKKGWLYWIFIGWWWELFAWLFLMLPKLLIACFSKKTKTVSKTRSVAVCQNCGNRWDVK